ncbi:pirin family protein [Microbulbifer guangxiensis]|uniref:pirin family protein n=1 Tax=Microbulbifer guangxiensis TaxID=2904249 RepID=UPI001F3D1130|nr:pirin family protein [Microbulbifer guangxiensis]
MSNLSSELEQGCDTVRGCEAVKMIIEPRTRDLAGIPVRRLLPTRQHRTVGPWIFFDHMGPADFCAGQGINVPPHPHINIATVTYLFEGEILHRDSLGSLQPIRPGEVNLMVAGAGIVHSERERDEVRSLPHRLHGLQLWLALPERAEECRPEFHHYDHAEIPSVEIHGVSVRVIMGSAFGKTSPVKTFAETLYVEAALAAGQKLLIPPAPERAIYVAAGELQARADIIPEHGMAILQGAEGIEVEVEAMKASRIAIIGGESIGKRHMDWNFASSRRERVEQAVRDWQDGRFARVPGDEQEFVPYPGS